jgi:hypothetical protein
VQERAAAGGAGRPPVRPQEGQGGSQEGDGPLQKEGRQTLPYLRSTGSVLQNTCLLLQKKRDTGIHWNRVLQLLDQFVLQQHSAASNYFLRRC